MKGRVMVTEENENSVIISVREYNTATEPGEPEKPYVKVTVAKTVEARCISEGDTIVAKSDVLWTPNNKWGSALGPRNVKLQKMV